MDEWKRKYHPDSRDEFDESDIERDLLSPDQEGILYDRHIPLFAVTQGGLSLQDMEEFGNKFFDEWNEALGFYAFGYFLGDKRGKPYVKGDHDEMEGFESLIDSVRKSLGKELLYGN